MQIHISSDDGVPIYIQIVNQVKHLVGSGRLTPGDEILPIRALAEQLVINPNTVARAYADLAREGLIESQPGRGVFITRKRKVFTREEGWRRLEPLIDAAIGEAMAMDFTHGELREAFEKKLGQWKPVKGGNRSDE